jgi:hypothetical protein
LTLVESCSCEKLEAGSWDREKFGNQDEGERPLLEAASKQRLVKTDDFICAVVTVTFAERNSVRLSWSFVVMFCQCPINSAANPNFLYSYIKSRDNTLKYAGNKYDVN